MIKFNSYISNVLSESMTVCWAELKNTEIIGENGQRKV